MSDQGITGFGGALPRKRSGPQDVEHVMLQRPLQRILAFTRHTIDDVINSPVARNEVLGYYKLHCWINRQGEIADLEKQWNPLGLRK